MQETAACENEQVTYLPTSPTCFVCGETNPAGLGIRFYVADGFVKARWRASDLHCGYAGVAHGGITAAVLDECMAWAAARAIGLMCVTGELTVRYLQRVPNNRTVTASARVTKSHRRIAYVDAAVTGDDGVAYARAEGRFLPLSAEETLEVDDGLIYRGGEERIFDALRREVRGAPDDH